MVIDTSALLAILLQEPEASAFAAAIDSDPACLLSAFSFLEAAIVIESRMGLAGGRDLDLAVHNGRIDVVPFDRSQAEIARDAYRRYGKGRHPAGLNLSDCAAYALSVNSGEPLLFKGEDFTKTDAKRWGP